MTFTVVAFCVSRRQLLGWALATGSAGVLIECAQLFIPGRDFEFSDLAANAVGSIAGYALASAILVMLVGPLRRATA
jgi:VanZ family protein